MKTRAILFLLAFILGSVFSTFGKVPITDTMRIRMLVEEEFKDFYRLLVAQNILGVHVSFSDRPSHLNIKTLEIDLNPSDIIRYTIDSPEYFQIEFIKYILSHEIAHIIQLREFECLEINKQSARGIRFLECEAEIIAGYLVAAKKNLVELKRFFPKFIQNNQIGIRLGYYSLFASLYAKIFSTFRMSASAPTHVGREDRLTAFKSGIDQGELMTDSLLSSTNRIKGYATQMDTMVRTFPIIAQLLQLHNEKCFNNKPFFWAANRALFILHEDNAVAKRIIIYNKLIYKTRENRVLRFSTSFSIWNSSSDTIRFIALLYDRMIQPNDTYTLLKTYPLDTIWIDTVINPKSEIKIARQFRYLEKQGAISNIIPIDFWNYYPDFVIPGDRESFYVAYTKRRKLMPEGSPFIIYNIDFEKWNDRVTEKVIGFIYDLLIRKENILALAKGVGRSLASERKELYRRGVKYQSLFRDADNNDGILCYVGDSGYNVIYGFYIGQKDSFTESRKHYKEIGNAIRREFPFWQFVEGTIKTDTCLQFNDSNGRSILRVILSKDDETQKYLLSISFNADLTKKKLWDQ